MFQDFKTHFYPHFAELQKLSLDQLFNQEARRYFDYQIEAAGLNLDFCRQPINKDSLSLLTQFCDGIKLREKIKAMFLGAKINITEKRAVLHTALRAPATTELCVDGVDISSMVAAELNKMGQLITKFHKKESKGASGKPITDVVNLGIGGSDLGPRMVLAALTPYHVSELKVHFVANVDGMDLYETLIKLNPETTAFIVASKSFTTEETLLNAKTARAWLCKGLGTEALAAHFIGITSRPEKAIAWGIDPHNIFSMWDFVGGRYSLWSSIGLPIALQIGMQHFRALLKGAYQLDQHFLHAPWAENLPVVMAFLGLMNQNFYGAESHAVIPYAQLLELFPAYLQQADMESNGKAVDKGGRFVDYQTGVPLWGGIGTNGQHAFHQLLHQGTLRIPVDFILPLATHHPYHLHQEVLIANCLAQAEALRKGRNLTAAETEFKAMGYSDAEAKALAPHKVIPGNRPANIIFMEQLSPEALGALIACYEHKILTQSIFWDTNAFDQWGVELGKAMAAPILAGIKSLSVVSLKNLKEMLVNL